MMLVFTACSIRERPKENIITVEDSVLIKENIYLKSVLKLTQDSLAIYKDTTIKADEFVLRYKLERIKYYTDIVDRKPSQIKYYKGWIKRVLNQ